jgi:hypothetical protein
MDPAIMVRAGSGSLDLGAGIGRASADPRSNQSVKDSEAPLGDDWAGRNFERARRLRGELGAMRRTKTERALLALAVAALATPAAAATYACQFKGKPLMLIDTTYQHEKLTIGKDSAEMQVGNGFLTADIDDEEYIFKLGVRGPDDPKIHASLDMGAFHSETICVRR